MTSRNARAGERFIIGEREERTSERYHPDIINRSITSER